MDEIVYQSATALAASIRRKELTSSEVVDTYLQRIKKVNPAINAVVQLVEERALEEARAADRDLHAGHIHGPLHGVPMTIKDSFDTAGIISTGGSLARKDFVPTQDASVVARLRGAGGILMGKSNTPELTLGWATENLVYGRTSNPYDTTRTPSATSGGAAAIIAAGGSPLDIGSDTGGSIREPAHVCGIAGIKPTACRVPRTGHIIPYGLGAIDCFTQIGPMARYVEDLALALPIMCGMDWQDPACVPMPLGSHEDVTLKGLRIAMYTDNGLVAPSEPIAQGIRQAAQALKDAGAIINEAVPEALGRGTQLIKELRASDGGAWVQRLIDRYGITQPAPMVSYVLTGKEAMSVSQYTALLEDLDTVRSEMLDFMRNFDAILCPPLPWAAVPHDTEPKAKYESWSNGYIYNLTGQPTGVVRANTTPEGLPVGVQIVGQSWREDVVLALLSHVEATVGGFVPPKL